MLWWFAFDIPDSDVNAYSTMNISNSSVGKYYVAKKMYGIPYYNFSDWTNKIKLNQCIHIFLFLLREKKNIIYWICISP